MSMMERRDVRCSRERSNGKYACRSIEKTSHTVWSGNVSRILPVSSLRSIRSCIFSYRLQGPPDFDESNGCAAERGNRSRISFLTL